MVIKANRSVSEYLAVNALTTDAEIAYLEGLSRADWLAICAIRAEHVRAKCCVPSALQRLTGAHIDNVAMIAAFTFITDRN